MLNLSVLKLIAHLWVCLIIVCGIALNKIAVSSMYENYMKRLNSVSINI